MFCGSNIIKRNINIKKLAGAAKLPTRGGADAAGYDLYACIESPIEIQPHETVKIGTGIAMLPPAGTFGAIFARSGIATKQGLRPANCVGVVDADYTGEWIVAMHNDSEHPQVVVPAERIAQAVFIPFVEVTFTEVEELKDTERGDGGFGHTGDK